MIGEKIRKARIAKKLSRKELAQKIGVSRIIIREWEKNKKFPRLKNIKKLETALNINFFSVKESSDATTKI